MTTTTSPTDNNVSSKPQSIFQLVLGVALVAALLLLIPFTASFITAEMEWTLIDYVLVWVMLSVAGTTYKLVSRLSTDFTYRAAVALAAVTGLLMVWSNLAVGIIGNEDNAINVVYFIIIMVGFIGAFWVRFQSKGLSRVLGFMVFLLAAVCTYALLSGMQHIPESSVMQIIGVHMFFITPLLISAILFHQHSQGQ
jgi:hypothetical protein